MSLAERIEKLIRCEKLDAVDIGYNQAIGEVVDIIVDSELDEMESCYQEHLKDEAINWERTDKCWARG